MGIVLFLIIILSMFQWTLYIDNIPNSDSLTINEYVKFIKTVEVIKGVQGRYLVPIIPLFLLPLGSKFMDKIIFKINYKFYLLVYYLIVFCYMFIIILNRYWLM